MQLMFALLPLLGFLGFTIGVVVVTLGICGFWVGVGCFSPPPLFFSHSKDSNKGLGSMCPMLNASLHGHNRNSSLGMCLRKLRLRAVGHGSACRDKRDVTSSYTFYQEGDRQRRRQGHSG